MRFSFDILNVATFEFPGSETLSAVLCKELQRRIQRNRSHTGRCDMGFNTAELDHERDESYDAIVFLEIKINQNRRRKYELQIKGLITSVNTFTISL